LRGTEHFPSQHYPVATSILAVGIVVSSQIEGGEAVKKTNTQKS